MWVGLVWSGEGLNVNRTKSQSYGFPSSHVWMWELDSKESWVLRNWCFWTVVLEKTLESPLDCKEIQPVHPKGDQSWVFIGRTDAEAETPVLWLPDAKNWVLGKDPDSGKEWRREEKGTTEDEMVGWHHQLNSSHPLLPTLCEQVCSLCLCQPWRNSFREFCEIAALYPFDKLPVFLG